MTANEEREMRLECGSQSDEYLTTARQAYTGEASDVCAYTVVTRWNVAPEDNADRPSPGGAIGWVHVDGMRNVRDIGGWNGLRPGMAFRGSEPDVHHAVTEKGRETLIKQLGIRTDLDLRPECECPNPSRSAFGANLIRTPLRAYLQMFDTLDGYAAALRVFADARNYPVYFHCWGGADRTGTLALLLEGLCGASEADLYIDYELSTFSGLYHRSRAPEGQANEMFRDLILRLKTYPGETMNEKITACVETTIGLSKSEIAAIRRNLLGVHSVLELPARDGFPRNGEGDFAKLNDGRVLFVYTEYIGGAGEDNDTAHLVKRLSSDGGETWTEPVEVVPRSGKMNDMSVSLLRLGDGRLAIFYLRKNSATDCLPMMRTSSDEGETWSAATCCLPSGATDYFVLNNARAERLKSGRIILPLARHNKDNPGGGSYGLLSVAYSDDDGETWRQTREIQPLDADGEIVCVQEPGVIELKDGRLYLYARTNRGCQWQAFSSDGGMTFTDFGPSPIIGPQGPATIRRLDDGRLLLVWNDHEGHPEYTAKHIGWLAGIRAPLTIAFSDDEGKTWTGRRTIEPDVSEKGFFCYFATLVDGNSLLLHYYCRPWLNDSRIVKIPL